MGAGLQLKKFLLESGQVDGEGSLRGRTIWQGVGEEGIVCLWNLR